MKVLFSNNDLNSLTNNSVHINNNSTNITIENDETVPIIMVRSVNTNGNEFNITAQKSLPSLMIPSILSTIMTENPPMTTTTTTNTDSDPNITTTNSPNIETTPYIPRFASRIPILPLNLRLESSSKKGPGASIRGSKSLNLDQETTTEEVLTTFSTEMGSTEDLETSTEAITTTEAPEMPEKIVSSTISVPRVTSSPVPTSKKPFRFNRDFVVYAILPNNSVAIKYPSLESDEEEIDRQRSVYGILPNNTMMKKYRNGTLKIVEEDVVVTNIHPRELWNPNSYVYKMMWQRPIKSEDSVPTTTDATDMVLLFPYYRGFLV